MQKKFITNLALLLFLNLLIKPFWVLGIDRAVQNAVGAERYGEYFALFNFSFLLNIILDFGITNFNNRNIAQNNHMLDKHLSSISVLKMLLGVIYLVVTIVCGLIIGYDFRLMKLLLVLGLNQFLISFILYLRSNLSGLHLFTTDSFISVLDRTLMIAICGVLLWGHFIDVHFDVMWFVYSQTVAYLLTALVTFIILFRKASLFKFKWNTPFFLMILKRSFPFAVLVLLMTFYNRIDTVMLERLLPDGATQAGIYASSYRLLDSANMIAFLFAGLLLPIFSKMIKMKDSVEALVKLSFSLLIAPAVIIAVGSFFYRHELMALLYHEHIEESAKVFGLIMFCFVAISTTYIFGTLLTANGNLKELNIMAAAGMSVIIIFNFILIPHYKAFGSAVSSVATQGLAALIQVVLVQRIFRFRVNVRYLVMLVLYVSGIILIYFSAKQLNYPWTGSFFLAAFLSLAFAFITRLISVHSILRIIRQE